MCSSNRAWGRLEAIRPIWDQRQDVPCTPISRDSVERRTESGILALQEVIVLLFFSSSFLEQTHTHTSIDVFEVFGNRCYLSSSTAHNPLTSRVVDSVTYRLVHQLNQYKGL